MNDEAGSVQHDPDGVRIVRSDAAGAAGGGTRLALQGLALFLAACCFGYLLMPRQLPAPEAEPPPADRSGHESSFVHEPAAAAESGTPSAAASPAAASVGAAARAASPSSARPVTPRRAAGRNANKALDDANDPDQQSELAGLPKDVTMGEYINYLHEQGIHEGLGAFNPPGTSPPLEGLAVPEDYELPEGYVRHYQATDDGQRIEPILMFSPDFDFYDANGNKVPIPVDRVVPPEMAPPGFPVRKIDIPPPREPGDTAR